jgi:hypothetical protein
MNWRGASIIAVMVVTFSGTVAVTIWQQRQSSATLATQHPVLSVAPIPPPAPARPSSVIATPVPNEIPRTPIARPPPLAEALEAQRLANGAGAGGPASTNGPELPVEVHFRRRVDAGRFEGSVVNHSDSELVLDAIIDNPRTKQTAKQQLDIQPYANLTFGLDDGLDLQSGDPVTLHGGDYADKVATVR